MALLEKINLLSEKINETKRDVKNIVHQEIAILMAKSNRKTQELSAAVDKLGEIVSSLQEPTLAIAVAPSFCSYVAFAELAAVGPEIEMVRIVGEFDGLYEVTASLRLKSPTTGRIQLFLTGMSDSPPAVDVIVSNPIYIYSGTLQLIKGINGYAEIKFNILGATGTKMIVCDVILKAVPILR